MKLRPSCALFVCIAVWICLAPRAAAQHDIDSIRRGVHGAPISSRELSVYVRILGLSDGQFRAIEPAYQRYLEQWTMFENEQVKPWHLDFYRRRDAMWAEQTPSPYGPDAVRAVRRFRSHVGPIDTELFESIEPFLTDQQLERLPVVLRQRQRHWLLSRRPDAMIGMRGTHGVYVDLRQLIQNIEPPANELRAIEPVLADYETDLQGDPPS